MALCLKQIFIFVAGGIEEIAGQARTAYNENYFYKFSETTIKRLRVILIRSFNVEICGLILHALDIFAINWRLKKVDNEIHQIIRRSNSELDQIIAKIDELTKRVDSLTADNNNVLFAGYYGEKGKKVKDLLISARSELMLMELEAVQLNIGRKAGRPSVDIEIFVQNIETIFSYHGKSLKDLDSTIKRRYALELVEALILDARYDTNKNQVLFEGDWYNLLEGSNRKIKEAIQKAIDWSTCIGISDGSKNTVKTTIVEGSR